ncbi:MAG: hypothetical protein ACE5OS_12265 [Anaerolineae bacterium]
MTRTKIIGLVIVLALLWIIPVSVLAWSAGSAAPPTGDPGGVDPGGGEAAPLSPAAVEHIYVAQTTQGAGDGSSPGNARSVDWFNTPANWSTAQAQDGLIGPGDTVHLCGVISSRLVVQGSGQEGFPITILFEQDAMMSAPYWSTWTPPFDQRGLPNDYSGTDEISAIYSNEKDHIVIDGGVNGVIEATECGTDWPDNKYTFAGIYGRGDHVEIKNLTIRNMYNRTPGADDYWSIGEGIFFAGSHLSVHDNMVEKAFYCLQVGARSSGATQDIEVYNNVISGCAVSLAATMGTNYTTLEDVRLHHNRMLNGEVWDGTLSENPFDPARSWHRRDFVKVWGRMTTSPFSPFARLSIYSNVIGPGLSSMRGTASGWICMDSGYFPDLEIHHNLFLSDETDAHAPFVSVSGITNYTTTMNSQIHNNTFVGNEVNDAPIRLGRWTLGHVVYDNIFFQQALGFYAMDPVTDISFWDYNNWYPLRLPGSFQYKYHHSSSWGTYPPYTYQQWKDELGFDAHSVEQDPLFVNADDPAGPDGVFWTDDDGLRLPPGSPSVGAGRFGGEIGAYAFEPALSLQGAPGSETIYLSWTVNVTLPVSTTWHIDYYTHTASIYTATEPLSATRSTVLTEHVENYQWYTVALHAMVDSTSWLSDTVRVMPTDRFVYLPLVMRED